MDSYLGQRVREILKRSLKQRGLTYRELAPRVGLSESGLKKLLTAKDFSLARLLALCEASGLSVAELFETAEREEIREVELSAKQQTALLRETGLLRVFWRACIELEDESQIRREEKLSGTEYGRLAARLEALELARPGKSGRLEPIHRGLYRWREGGPLVERLNRDWSLNLLEAALRGREDSAISSLHRLSGLRLSREEASELRRRLGDLLDEFARLSAKGRWRESGRRESRPVRVVVAVAPGRLIDP